MGHISETITIARPVESVFAFAANYRNDPQWRTGVTEMTVTPDAIIHEGSITREILHFAGQVYKTQAHVVTWKPNQHAAFKSFEGNFPVEGERRFEHLGTETRFTYVLDIFPQSLTDKLMMPFLAIIFRNRMRHDLQKLKDMLEQN